MRKDPNLVAKEILKTRYPDADVLLLCGSVVRGDFTETSDLDIVVLYKKLENARRESFYFLDWPVEVFIHDLETLHYFFEEVDRKTRCPSLAQMVQEGVVIGAKGELLEKAKKLATDFLKKGPRKTDKSAIDNIRYGITDLLTDIKSPRSNEELVSIGVCLFEVLSDLIFKSHNSWSGKGKWVSRRLKEIDHKLEADFFNAFNYLFSKNDSSRVIALSEIILERHGGQLFGGHDLDAPKEWRLVVKK